MKNLIFILILYIQFNLIVSIDKCCDHNQHLIDNKKCKNNILPLSSTYKLNIYTRYNKFNNIEFKQKSIQLLDNFILENGNLYIIYPNTFIYKYYIDTDYYCVDYYEDKESVWIIPDDESGSIKYHIIITEIITCVFLFITFIIFLIVDEYKKHFGKLLMVYIFNLFMAFSLLISMQLLDFEESECIIISSMIYFFLISSFTWLNVISFNVWKNITNYNNNRVLEYLYGIIIPISMTILLIILNEIDMKDYPWIITPQIPQMGCFLTDGQQFIYLYIPLLILIFINVIFYILTIINLKHNKVHYNYTFTKIIIKLTIIMGLNWIFEILSFIFPDYKIWNITDIFNCLIGLWLFIILICETYINKIKIQR
ncbi:unknown similar to AMEV261 [Choristoneura rosaceana entomopoxvirus 'L']|uniref:G-protein coupled receptors family 2 profile 2 domain-containing protein n=1 Tax=Choristoneura rosaceana entomopoxvirus 'L' TaxID=1293539 RepID=A0ABM9QK58_9POXV|nr:unknown similar to AMEV261 [Choristoneura rosaceana entomopoxvirus 'L']CCU55913.1 unknown similar to AMEV261 [Choristoneura rosaceana entomopoxvirus 'L']